MNPQVRTEVRRCRAGFDGTVYILEADGAKAEIWPALGFNCFSWQVPHRGEQVELLWSDPQLFDNPQPTRSGIPILFPFPNRIRGGRFTWAGKEYQLPINDPQQKNAIHGFACYRPWRVVGCGTHHPSEKSAWIRGAFQASRDAPDCRSLWPGDYVIEVTYTLSSSGLRLDVLVTNPDIVALPFGFGLHPYFRFPADNAQFHIEDQSLERWLLDDCLPSGERAPLDGQHRLLVDPKRWTFPSLMTWDDAYRLTRSPMAISLIDRSNNLHLSVECSQMFRDLVIFTPPHRQAVCLEPYTCVTDAINLQARGIDAGLIVLPPGRQWRGSVSVRGMA